MVKLFGIKNCDKCRAAIKWLSARDIEHEFVDIRETPLSDEQLELWQDALGWEAVVNKRSTTWKTLNEAECSDLTPAKSRELILANPTLMKRPVITVADAVYHGFSEASYSDIFN